MKPKDTNFTLEEFMQKALEVSGVRFHEEYEKESATYNFSAEVQRQLSGFARKVNASESDIIALAVMDMLILYGYMESMYEQKPYDPNLDEVGERIVRATWNEIGRIKNIYLKHLILYAEKVHYGISTEEDRKEVVKRCQQLIEDAEAEQERKMPGKDL